MRRKTIMMVALLAIGSTNALAEDNFGLGAIVGEPTGLSLKYWFDDENAIDGAVAWSFSGDNSLQLHADYLRHYYFLDDSDELMDQSPVYYGIGGRLKFKQDEGNDHDDTVFGVRLPLGVTYLFKEAPFDIFAEIAPVVDLSPDFDLELNLAIGLRFYFD